jgi:hypothetical protein
MEVSETATEVLARAYVAAARFNPDAKVRIYRRKGVIQTGFADAPVEGDVVMHHEGMTLYIAPDVGDGTLTTSPEHDQLMLMSD